MLHKMLQQTLDPHNQWAVLDKSRGDVLQNRPEEISRSRLLCLGICCVIAFAMVGSSNVLAANLEVKSQSKQNGLARKQGASLLSARTSSSLDAASPGSAGGSPASTPIALRKIAIFDSPIIPSDKTKSVPMASPAPLGHPGGMAVARPFLMTATINISDTPLSYSPPVGKKMEFEVSYNGVGKPSDQKFKFNAGFNEPASFSNLGTGWSFNWVAYLTKDSSGNVKLMVPGGGAERYKYQNEQNPYAPNLTSHAILVPDAHSSTLRRLLPDGSVEVYDLSDKDGRIFMTKLVDAHGNEVRIEYDNSFRICSVIDAIGQKSIISHLSDDPKSSGYFKIAKVKDPFGRTCQFQYDPSESHLLSITDSIGLSSKFIYEPNSFEIVSLLTPYGRTNFEHYHPKGSPLGSRGLRINYPDLTSAVYENWTGNINSTYEWSRRTLKLFPDDPSKHILSHCTMTQWLLDRETHAEVPVQAMTKPPLESPTVYRYEGQEGGNYNIAGSSNLPVEILRKVRVVEPNGAEHATLQIQRYAYNKFGHKTKEVDPVGRTFSYVYAKNDIDLLEKRQTKGSKNELIFKQEYNDKHLPVKVYNAGGELIYTYEYNKFGQQTKSINSREGVVSASYDNKGYLLKIESSVPTFQNLAEFTYDNCGRMAFVARPDGSRRNYSYDSADRITQISYPDGTNEQIKYDKLDAVLYKDRSGRITKRAYSSLDQIVSVEDPSGRKTTFEWCSCGSLLNVTDPMGNVTSWHHDIQGRTIQKKFANGTEIKYGYEKDGHRLQSITDAMNQSTNYFYNLDDTVARISFTNPVNETSPITFTWGTEYKVVTAVKNDWGEIKLNHTEAETGRGLLRSVANNVIPNSTIKYDYDVSGKMTSREIGDGGYFDFWKYDELGRSIAEANNLGQFNFEYADSLSDKNSSKQLRAITYPNGAQVHFHKDTAVGVERLRAISNTLGSDKKFLSRFKYDWDNDGQIRNIEEQFASTNAEKEPAQTKYEIVHDAIGQITQTKAAAPQRHNYQYEFDKNCNLTVSLKNGNNNRFHYDNMNQLVNHGSEPSAKVLPTTAAPDNTTKSPASFAYDKNGNMTSDGKNLYKWDAENRLISIVYPGNGNHSEFFYNPMEKCAKIVETRNGKITSTQHLIWCLNKLCEIRNEDGSARRIFEFGESIVSNPKDGKPGEQTYFFLRDNNESTRQVLDASGRILGRQDFDSYGNNTNTDGDVKADIGFAGYFIHEPSGLYLTPFRAYNSHLGRWLSRDPLGEFGSPQQPEWKITESNLELIALNPYAYSNNNGFQYRDPLGLTPCGTPTPRFDLSVSMTDVIHDVSNWAYGQEGIDTGPSILTPLFPEFALDSGQPARLAQAETPTSGQTINDGAYGGSKGSSSGGSSGGFAGRNNLTPYTAPFESVDLKNLQKQLYFWEGGKEGPKKNLFGFWSSGTLFDTKEDAVRAWATSIYNTTVKDNVEYATLIYQYNGKWAFTISVKGKAASSDSQQVSQFLPPGAKNVAYAHTHGGVLLGTNGEIFSNVKNPQTGKMSGDIPLANEAKVDSYMVAPSGKIWAYYPPESPNNQLTNGEGQTKYLGSVFGK